MLVCSYWICLALTCLSTVTYVSSVFCIPIIILTGSHLSWSTKFGLAVFLCLSIFMAIFAIVRIAGFHYKGREDDVWESFCQHSEGAVSVMMASITAFRIPWQQALIIMLCDSDFLHFVMPVNDDIAPSPLFMPSFEGRVAHVFTM